MARCIEHGQEQILRSDGTYSCPECWVFHKQSACLCNQHNCTNKGAFRFTWPGKDEQYVCEQHVGQLLGIVEAMGMHLQVIPL